MKEDVSLDDGSAKWETVILNEGEGEKILFRIGLMTFKVASSQTNNAFVACETELPPEANVEPHAHPEAELFYILEGEFTFLVEGVAAPQVCKKGAFVLVPPYVVHSFKNTGARKGKIFGMITPGGAKGLESLFRNFGVQLSESDITPEMTTSISNLK